MVHFKEIVGKLVAKEAIPHSWPANVNVEVCANENLDWNDDQIVCHYCGGTLIDLTTVVTSGKKN